MMAPMRGAFKPKSFIALRRNSDSDEPEPVAYGHSEHKMHEHHKTRSRAISLRLTEDERCRLEKQTVDMSLGGYIRLRLPGSNGLEGARAASST